MGNIFVVCLFAELPLRICSLTHSLCLQFCIVCQNWQ